MKRAEMMLLGLLATGTVALVLFWIVYSQPEADMETGLGTDFAQKKAGDRPSTTPEAAMVDADLTEREAVAPAIEGKKPGNLSALSAKITEAQGQILGRVVSESGMPLVGAKIELDLDRVGMIYDMLGKDQDKAKSRNQGITETGADGYFKLEKIQPDPSLVLKVNHADHVAKTQALKTYTGASLDLGDIVLELGGVVSGFVRDERGVGIASATVQAQQITKNKPQGDMLVFSLVGRDAQRTVTGPDGAFRITGLPAGKINLFGNHPEYVDQSVGDISIQKGREQGPVILVLPQGQFIEGIVMDMDEKPVEGARVRVDNTIHIDLDEIGDTMPQVPNWNISAQTDKDGLFRLSGLVEGAYTVRVDEPGFLAYSTDDVKTGTRNLRVILQTAGWVAGRVTSARTGDPVNDFEVRVENDQWNRSKIKIWEGAEALEREPKLKTAEGAYFVEGLEPGSYTLTCEAEGFGIETQEHRMVAAGKGEILDLSLQPESIISGRLLTSQGDPVEDGRIHLTKAMPEAQNMGQGGRIMRSLRVEETDGGIFVDDGGEKPLKSVSSDEKGRFILRGIPQGAYELTASHEDHTNSLPLPVNVDQGDRVENLELRLGLSGSIKGTVYDVFGEAKPGARVQCRELTGQDFLGTMASADSEGVYGIKGLSPGEYQVRLLDDTGGGSMGGFMTITMGSEEELPAGAVRVAVEEGQVSKVDLFEIARASLAGKVTEAGSSVPGCGIKLFKQGPFLFMPDKTAKTDEHGEYLMEGIMPGDYVVRVDLAGLPEDLEEEVKLEEGLQGRKDFALPTGRVTGLIVDAATKKPLAGARVRLEKVRKEEEAAPQETHRMIMTSFATADNMSDGSGGVQTITMNSGEGQTVKSDASGRYEIPHVGDGNYKVVAEKPGFAKIESAPVKIKEGRECDAGTLGLKQGFKVAGKLIDAVTGNSVSYCPIEIQSFDADGNLSDDRNVEMSEGNGSFTLEDMKPGKYRLSVDSDRYQGEKEMVIQAGDLENFEFAVRPKA
ncbi:MAG: carboxypeptidase regulatory-like domain-containing protein [Planctomycetes bacterium]|nr:carboxypeptidase regulatory-like domain-containing protein [Planctomycetota bacterium]